MRTRLEFTSRDRRGARLLCEGDLELPRVVCLLLLCKCTLLRTYMGAAPECRPLCLGMGVQGHRGKSER